MKLLLNALVKYIFGLVLVGVLLFLPAGTQATRPDFPPKHRQTNCTFLKFQKIFSYSSPFVEISTYILRILYYTDIRKAIENIQKNKCRRNQT